MFNKNLLNESFNKSTEQSVWEKGRVIPNFDANIWRWDSCGKVIKRNEYGNINSENGWEIDHIKPKAKGGTDDLNNLQPMQWENNRYKADAWPNWTCKPKAA